MRSIVQVYPGPPEIGGQLPAASSQWISLATGNWKLATAVGAVAQLGERLVCNQEATGSIPVSSTIFDREMIQSDVGCQSVAGIEHWVGGASESCMV